MKGVKTVILEAGGRHEIADFNNDEWGMFGQISWLDKRTTSGDWRWRATFPACRPGSSRRSAVRPCTGPAHRCASRSMNSRRAPHYGDVPGANLLDWPIDLAEMEPWYAKAEDKMGVTRTNNIPVCPAATTSRS